MADPIKMRISLAGDVATVKVLMPHPMETGLRKDPNSEAMVPMHFIHHVTAALNDRPVLDAQWSRSVSRNPFLEFRVRGARPGDKVVITWEDNLGGRMSGEAVIK
ncbi:MAG: thiosulfate oxidation carrier complex protein SoxZ [Betaproteobacteria bacterium]|nr:thiosulfate oxidation carrier complex protein SoxZ [Betaproteobacteria bacterium]MBL8535222.1 thiosulfate oxidation carrier complex protein SoxZ [Betaproteobacteria bacterium]